jgi:Protein of unknown function (DUF3618)
MSSDQRPPQEERLQEEIQELRSDLGGTVEALVHKVDVPARARERSNELTQEALERGIELHQQAVERGSALAGQAIERGSELKTLVAERGSELCKRAIDAVERTREAVGQTQMDRWARLATTGVALITLVVIVRRVRRS